MYILVVDDDVLALDLVRFVLESGKYEVGTVDNAYGAMHLIERRVPDLLLVDIKMPGVDGFTFSHQLREYGYHIPLIYVTACASLEERMRGFDTGAQDYICKPYFPQELLARVNIAARLQGVNPPPRHIRAGAMELIPETLQVIIEGANPVTLTPIEMQILLLLMNEAGHVVRRDVFLTQVWREQTATSNNLDVVIGHLRRKLGKIGKQIICIRGIGYRLIV